MTDTELPPREEEPALVLVVDDNDASRYVTCSWLRRHGHHVVEAATGTDSLAALARWPQIDLVLLDVNLPDMSGFDVCERIKSDPALGHPVVHLSATSVRGSDRAAGLTRGADAYLVEPVEPEELVATIGSVLRYYRARQAAEDLADRLSGLSRASLAMNAAADVAGLIGTVATGAAEMLAVPAAVVGVGLDGERVVALADPRRTGEPQLRVVDPGSFAELFTAPSAPGIAVEVPWQLFDPTSDPRPADVLLFRSRSSPPMALAVQVTTLHRAQADLLAQLGQAAVSSLDALRLHRAQRDLVLTLQRSFLPSMPALRAGLQIAARYQPASQIAEIGGDFYELIELDADRLLVAIGDVAGHSTHAATVMVELRHALRAYASEGHSAEVILTRLEHMMAIYHADEYATLCLTVLDLSRGTITVANAGHLPPLLVDSRRGGLPRRVRPHARPPPDARPGHGRAAAETGHHGADHRRPRRDARGVDRHRDGGRSSERGSGR